MTYYYQGSPILAPYTIKSNEPIYSATTVSMKESRASQGVQRWEISFNVRTRDNAVDILFAGIDEMKNAATMIMPQFPEVANYAITGTIDVNAVSNISATSVTISKTLAAGTLKKGAFIKFDNHDKVYMVTEDVSLSGTGDTTLPIYPALRAAIDTTTDVKYGNNCLITYVRDVSNIQGITFSGGLIANPGTINLVESL